MTSELEDEGKLEHPDEQDEQGAGQQGEPEQHDEQGTTEHHDEQDVEVSTLSDDEREAIRAARREERRARKDRAREREQTYVRQIRSLSQQNNDLAARLANLENRQRGVDFARVDSALESAAGEAEYWKGQIAVNAARGAEGAQELADAQDRFYQARRRSEDLAKLKQAAVARARAPSPMDPSVQRSALEWTGRNRWYDPQGRDPDSRVVLALDDGLTSEGFDPRTPEYWEELDTRVRKYLPHRTERTETFRKPNNGKEYNNGGSSEQSPVSGSEREVQGNRGTSGYRLSKERVDALKEAGMWDDPEARARMTKRYMEMDRANQKH